MFTRITLVILLMTSLSACLETIEESRVSGREVKNPLVQDFFFTSVKKEKPSNDQEFEQTSGQLVIESAPKNQRYFILTNQSEYLTKDFLDNRTGKNPDTDFTDANLQPTMVFNNNPLPFADYGDYRTANTGSNAEPHTYNVYEDKRSSVSLVAEFEGRNEFYLQVGGENFSGTLPSGKQTYTGANFVTNTGDLPQNENERVLYPGTFELTIDFSTRKGNITTLSESAYIIKSGEIFVHNKNGAFSGTNLELVDKTKAEGAEGQTQKGAIIGSLHGIGGDGVTGNYHNYVADSGKLPTLIGSIVGSRKNN